MPRPKVRWALQGIAIAVLLTVLGIAQDHLFHSGDLVTPTRIILLVFMGILGLILGYSAGRRMENLITARENLTEANHTLNALIEASPLPIFSVDAAGRFQKLWNPAAEKLMGISPSEAQGREIPFELEDGAGWKKGGKELVAALSGTGRSSGVNLRLEETGGGHREFSAYGAPLRDGEGRVSGYVILLVDQSERREAEQALDLERRQLLSIFDSIEEPIYVSDPETYELLFVNRKVRDHFGEVVGKKCHAVIQGLPEPCPFCTNSSLFGDSALDTYIWQHQNRQNGRWYRCMDKAIRWTDGRLVRFEVAVDITDHIQSDALLQEAHEEIKAANRKLEEDIETRRKAEEGLAQSEARYRLLADNVQDGIWTSDENLRFTYVSPSNYRIMGLPPGQEGVGESIFTTVAPQSRKAAEESVRKAIGRLKETGKPFPLKPQEMLQERPDGLKLWTEIQTSLMVDENGKFKGLIGVTRDITRRKAAQEELEKSEARYRDLLENAADIIYTLDMNGVFTEVNNMFLEHGGWAREDVVGKNFRFMLHSDDILVAMKAFEEGLSGNTFTFEMRARKKDGSYGYYSFTNRPLLDEEGKVVSLHGMARDITKRKLAEDALRESENRYRALFESAPDAMFLVDPRSGEIQDLNEAAARLFSASREELAGLHHTSLYPEKKSADNVALFRSIRESDEEGRGLPPQETLVRDFKGRDLPVEISGSIVQIRNRPAVQLTLRDATLRKKMEEEILRARKSEAVGLLAGGIAHEFNNLLGIILTGIEITRVETENRGQDPRHLAESHAACLRARDLTRRFITYSTGGAPKKKILAADGLFQEAAELFLAGSSVALTTDFPEDLWGVLADEGQMQSVIGDLVTNAREAMPKGGTLHISAANQEITQASPEAPGLAPGRYVKISLEDTGHGIESQNLPLVFDAYFSTKERGAIKGVGLGLAIASSVVRRHGGAIFLASDPGSGTRATLYLPAADGSPEEEGPGEEAPPVPDPSSEPLKLLVMDDEVMVRTLAANLLARLGHEAATAGHGEEAVALYQKAMNNGRPFDLVILDLTVKGGLGGLETLERLKTVDPQVRAVVSSGHIESRVLNEYRDYGFVSALDKPYTLEQCRKVLAEAGGK